jgi:hypothetical protein
MNTVVALLLILMAEIGVILLGGWNRRDLQSCGARPVAYWIMGLSSFLAGSALLAWWVFGSLSGWLVALFVAPEVAVSLLPSRLVALTGGKLPAWHLAEISAAISARWDRVVSANELTEADGAWFQERSRDLNRWRSGATAELVDLYQAKIADLLKPEVPDDFAQQAATRNAKIDRLQESVFREYCLHARGVGSSGGSPGGQSPGTTPESYSRHRSPRRQDHDHL